MSDPHFKPLLSAKIKTEADLKRTKYPILATPKIDGIRCLTMRPLGAVSRSLKPIRNDHIRELVSSLPPYMDGELVIVGAKCFGDTSGPIMRKTGTPDFVYHVFDTFRAPQAPYKDRAGEVRNRLGRRFYEPRPWLNVLSPTMIHDEAGLLAYEVEMLAKGFEGVMFRQPDSIYKYGRATLCDGTLTALKRFEDAEARIVGFSEQMHNANPLERDALGLAKRSTKREGLQPAGTLGKIHCVRCSDGVEFAIGTGFSDAERAEIWADRPGHLDRLVKFRSQAYGAKNAPRIVTFLGFRDPEDT